MNDAEMTSAQPTESVDKQPADTQSADTQSTAGQPEFSEKAQTLLKNLQETLNGEKWTRASLGNYSTNQFKELDDILKTAREEKIVDEVKNNCDGHLANSRNSIIALYLSGMIALSRQIIDDAAIISLVSIFLDNNKWGIVKYLCERILAYGESKFALRTLADCHKNDNEEDLIYGVWERLIKVDFEEADITKSLAEYYEKQGKKDEAVDYYKKALHRYINKNNYANVREIWEKLLEINIEDIEFFLHIQKKIAKAITEDKAVVLLNELYAKYKDIDIDISIAILKIVLEYDEKDVAGRREIIECFRKKYASHSQLEEYIRVSNLSQNYRAVQQAIADFEKHIAFDKGNYVHHRTWGVGRIALIQGDDIRIDFSKKRGHSMSLKMAVDALQTLSKEHIWVLKATMKREELKDKVKSDTVWALKTIIKSFDNSCDMKKVKAEVSPALLSTGEWATWNSKARDILKTNPDFGVNPDNTEVYFVRERPTSLPEKFYNEFNAQKNFLSRISVIRDYVSSKDTDPESRYFSEMFSFYTGTLRSGSSNPEHTIASWLLLNEITQNKKYAPLKSSLTVSFTDVFAKIEDIPAVFKLLKDTKFKEDFLVNVKQHITGWADIYIKLFPFALMAFIITHLEKEGHGQKLTGMCNDCFDNFRENREAAVWIYKNSRGSDWFKNAGITEEKQLITLIHIMDITYRDIENNKDTVENRKINKLVHNILFKDKNLLSYIDASDEDAIIRIFTFVNGVKDLDPQDKLNLRSRIVDKYPNFKFLDDTEKKVSRGGLIVTRAMYKEKQKLLAFIMEEEIPKNSKDIEYALSLGDLRENAEFKAAKEKQEQLNIQVVKLKEDLEKAKLFDPNSISTNKVSFGTKVVLYNETAGKQEEYTILGPWESDSEKSIISYLSPFGNAILNKKEGEKFEFAFEHANSGDRISYVVNSITQAEI